MHYDLRKKTHINYQAEVIDTEIRLIEKRIAEQLIIPIPDKGDIIQLRAMLNTLRKRREILKR